MSHRRSKRSHARLWAVCGILVAAVIAAVSGCYPVETVPPEPGDETIALDKTELTLYLTTSATLRVSPEGTTAEWHSSDEGIATVDGGVVRAVGVGSAVITAKTATARAECRVTVIPLPEVTVEDSGSPVGDDVLNELRGLTAQHPLGVSVYYRELETGRVVEYNSAKKYQAGSVVKAPYCKWLISSGADLNETLSLQQNDIREGGGTVKDSPLGTAFTVHDLIQASVVESDNTAYSMLAARFGFKDFTAYAKGLGIGVNQSVSNIFGSMSAIGAGIYFTDIYQWSVSAPEQSTELISMLCNTSYRKLISAAVESTVAHKYGYNGGTNGFHDAAIVYDEHPYVLTIFTSLNPDQSDTVPYIQAIAKCLDKIAR